MTREKRSWLFQLAWLGLLALVIFTGGLLVGAPARAEVSAQPLYQATGYPIQGLTGTAPVIPGYPVGTDQPVPLPTQPPQATQQPVETLPPELDPPGTSTIDPSLPSATISPDLFGTENAEMNAAQVTPPGTATQAPSLTPYQSPTPENSTLPAAAPTGPGNGRFQVDWGLFWIGFAIPILIACGVVLYLLDRRPNLFRSIR